MPKEPGEQPREEEEKSEKNPILETRDQMMEQATDIQRKGAEIQGAKYQTALLTIMERSDDNTELVNALNKFLNSLDWRANRGESGGPLKNPDSLAKFLDEMAEELHRT